MDLENLKTKLRKFSKDRDWEKFHSPKNIAIALSVEASELLEIFQWSKDGGFNEIKDLHKKKEIENEIADVFNYLVKLVDILDLDLETISMNKIIENEKKYPIEKVKGKALKYSKY